MANEKRLIDANKLFDDVENSKYDNPHTNGRVRINHIQEHDHFMKMIFDAPTVEAVEVVHGQWFVIEDDYFDLVELKCSACGESWGFEDYEDCIPQNYHYCPNCGAKMDGGVKNA